MESSNNANKALVGIIVVVLIAAVATAVIVLGNNNATKENAVIETSASVSPSLSPTTDTPVSSKYADGTFDATGTYQTPGGQESIGVTVTLSNGVITNAIVEQHASGGEAEEYQSRFTSAFKSLVVGKKIDEVSLDRVAGSSLTPNGFNSAIDDIETQARA